MKMDGTFSRKPGFENLPCTLLMLGREVRVPCGPLNVFVAHQLLNGTKIDPSHDQAGSKSMTEGVRAI